MTKNGRNGYRVLVFSLLMIAWVIFSGLIDGFHLSLGLISCGIVTWMSSDLLFENRWMPLRKRIRQGFLLGFYFLWLIWQVILSNIHLLKLAFGPRSALSPQIIKFESNLESDFEKFLLANSITLTPGTVTMKIIGQTFYIHAISDIAADGLDGEMERRIAKIFAR
ncbi:MAG: Na+/H+ antiporter subunit E [Verrucomicrobiales bacterium]|nr:Na+/H+ antiporter subunit E [Verrucomicrobiales bacterium]